MANPSFQQRERERESEREREGIKEATAFEEIKQLTTPFFLSFLRIEYNKYEKVTPD